MNRRLRRPYRPTLFALEGREVPAAVGGLDPSFGTLGKFDFSVIAGQNHAINAIAVQPDGKIVVAGTTDTTNPASADFLIARLNPNGTLDTTFNGSGKVTVNFGAGSDDEATGVGVLADGSIVAGGFTNKAGNYDFAAVKLNTNGGLDPGFGTGGLATFNISGEDKAFALALTPDRTQVVLAGASSIGANDDVSLLRLSSAGTIDPGFNGGAAKVFPLGFTEQARAAVVQQDGQIVLAGFQTNGANTDSIALRVAANGSATDPAFGNTTSGGNKFDLLDLGNEDKALAVAIQPDNNVVIAGYASPTAGNKDFSIARLKGTDGSLDTTFNTTGKLTVDFGGTDDEATSVLIQPDVKIVVSGFSNATAGNQDMAVARLTTAGKLDTSFDTTGKSTVDFGGVNDQSFASAFDAAGRVMLAGRAGANAALARLVGTIEPSNELLVGGTTNGQGVLFTAPPGGNQFATPGTTVNLLPGASTAVRTAVADVNGDGIADLIAVSGPGGPATLTVLNGKDNSVLVAPFNVFEASFTGGAFVSAADLNGDGKADLVVTPDQGGGPVVALYDGAKLSTGSTADAAQIVRFFGINDPAFRGGARSALGDVNADGTPDLAIAAGFTGGPRVALYSGKQVIANASALAAPPGIPGASFQLVPDFFAFENTVRNGVFVAIGDVDGDGFGDLVLGGGPTAGPRVRVISGKQVLSVSGLGDLDANVAATPALQLANFFAGDPNTRGGVPVAVKDVDGDNKADLVTGSGQNLAGFPALPAKVLVFRSATVLSGSGNPTPDQSLDVFGNATLAGGVFVG